MSRISVMIAEDNGLLRDALATLLPQHEDIQVVGTASDGLQAMAIAEALQPNVLLLDIWMPGVNGLQALPKIRARSPRTKILIYTGSAHEAFAARALMYGAKGFITKTGTPAELVKAIRAVHSEEIWAGRRVLTQALDSLIGQAEEWRGMMEEVAEGLTRREREIIRWAHNGMTNKEIASHLGISDMTVKTHLGNIFKKLRVCRRVQLHRYTGSVQPT